MEAGGHGAAGPGGRPSIGWRGLAAVVVGAAVAWGALSYVALTIGVLADGYGYGLAVAADFATAELAAMALASIASGFALRRISVRRLAVAGALCAAAGNAATAGASLPSTVLIWRIVAGAGFGAMTGGLNTSISRTGDPHRVFLRANFGCITGAAIFFAVLPEIYGRFGFRSYFLAYAVVCALAAFALGAIPAHARHGGEPAGPSAARFRHAGFFVGASVLWLCYAAVWSLSERLGRDIGMNEQAVGRVLGLGTLCGLIGAGLAVAAGQRLRPLRPLLATSLATGLCYVWWAYSDSAGSYTWVLCIWGIVFCPMLAYLYAVGSEIDASGGLNRLVSGGVAISTALGPVLAAAIERTLGYHGVGLFALAGTVLACIAIARHGPSRSIESAAAA